VFQPEYGTQYATDVENGGTVTWSGADSTKVLTPAYGLVSEVLDGPDGGRVVTWTVDFEAGVSRYEVDRYRDGAWMRVDEVAAHGAGEPYSVTDAEGVMSDHYRIVSVDVTGFTQTFAAGTNADGSKDWYINLQQGWNLVSLPCQAIDLSEFYAAVTGTVWTWNAVEVGYRALEGIPDPMVGLWVFAPEGREVPVSGFAAASSSVQLEAGWNLVGPVENCLVPAGLDDVYSWEGTYQEILSGDVPGLIATRAYWIFSTQSTTVELPPRE